MALSGAAATILAWVACPLFGPAYSPGLVPLVLLFSPSVLCAAYCAYALAKAALLLHRQLLVVSVTGILTKVAVIGAAVGLQSLALLYASGVIAAAPSLAATTLVRMGVARPVPSDDDVFIPAKNAARTIELTLRSLQVQAQPPAQGGDPRRPKHRLRSRRR